jgi:hypothetical protein
MIQPAGDSVKYIIPLAMTVKGAWQFAIVGFAKDSNHPASQQLGITGTGNFHIDRFDAGG